MAMEVGHWKVNERLSWHRVREERHASLRACKWGATARVGRVGREHKRTFELDTSHS
jgi:hypothetical protein